MTTFSPSLLRSIIWRSLSWPGAEYAALLHVSTGFRFQGVVVAAPDGQPLHLRYQIDCDDAWETREVQVQVVQGLTERRLHLRADEQRRWWRDDAEVEAIRGCVDVDLSLSPATNTLPIRRLALPAGGYADVTAAWVKFPDLDLQPLPQRYTRLGPATYRYESGTGYSTELEVDDQGMIVHYRGGWERNFSFGEA